MSIAALSKKLRHAADVLDDLLSVIPSENKTAARAIARKVDRNLKKTTKPLHWTKRPGNAGKVAGWKRIMRRRNAKKEE